MEQRKEHEGRDSSPATSNLPVFASMKPTWSIARDANQIYALFIIQQKLSYSQSDCAIWLNVIHRFEYLLIPDQSSR